MSDSVGSVLVENEKTEDEPAVPHNGQRQCMVCQMKLRSHVKRHVLKVHLPWYTDPTAACWECEGHVRDISRHLAVTEREHSGNHNFSDVHVSLWCRLMFGILVFFSNYFELESVSFLLGFVLSNKLFPSHQATFDFAQIHLLQKLCTSFEFDDVPAAFTVSPPNHVVCILHWSVLMRLLHFMKSVDDWNEFKSLNLPIPFPNHKLCTMTETYVDSHCHLDKIYKGYKFRSVLALKDYLSREQHGTQLQFLICNFVFPYLWWTKKHLLGVSSLVFGTVGVHPHFVQPGKVDNQLQRVTEFLDGSDFVGVGEVGLDFTGDCPCSPKCTSADKCPAKLSKIQAQRLFLNGVLPLADQYHLPLVIHCRDDGEGAAAEEVRNLILDKGLAHLKIHRHCFIGCVAEMHRWIDSFPNVMFGFTTKSLGNQSTCAALSRLGLDRILAETDAPYFKKTRSPWHIPEVVKHISEIKNLPLSVVCAALLSNTKQMYGI